MPKKILFSITITLHHVNVPKSSIKGFTASRPTILWQKSTKNTATLPIRYVSSTPENVCYLANFFLPANYTFGTKEAQPEEDPSVLSRLNRLQEHYEKYGMRRSCEAILIVLPIPFDNSFGVY